MLDNFRLSKSSDCEEWATSTPFPKETYPSSVPIELLGLLGDRASAAGGARHEAERSGHAQNEGASVLCTSDRLVLARLICGGGRDSRGHLQAVGGASGIHIDLLS